MYFYCFSACLNVAQNENLNDSKTDRVLNADISAVRRLLTSLWLGFASYVASLFLIIPEWTGLTRDAWLIVTLVTLIGAVGFLFGTLAAFAPAQGSEPKAKAPAPTTTPLL
jgi:hypothetical protein